MTERETTEIRFDFLARTMVDLIIEQRYFETENLLT
jgi:hypothetical protein